MPKKQEGLSEADTRAKLITPALHWRGWTEDMIRREETAGEIVKTDGGARRSAKRADYVLRVLVDGGGVPVPVALIEAKSSDASPTDGMEQAKSYARRFNVPFVYSSNGHQFAEYDAIEEKHGEPTDMQAFPRPEMLRLRYEEKHGFSLDDELAKPLSTPYHNGDGARRYYQDAAIRAALEKIAFQSNRKEPPRVLLSLATGAGKTFIAVNLLRRIADAGQLRRALFLCDRDALRQQALASFQAAFGRDAEVARRGADGGNVAKNARVHIATYQTLGISGDDDDDATFAGEHYPPGYFSHVIVDECHRSLRNGWAEILRNNQDAAHIGLTATPRQVRKEGEEDRELSARNIEYFGEPIYAYSLAQGTRDGYLALCEIHKSSVNLDRQGLSAAEVMRHNPTDYRTGKPLTEEEIREMYEKRDYEGILLLPDRVREMCADLFSKLLEGGDPRQKTIIFCVRREHAQMVAANLNNLYADWRRENGADAADPYAFVCMAGEGDEHLADFRGADNRHFAAATVDLLTTGVDIPCVRNIAFFCYVKSPIRLMQMIGRGARIDVGREKFSFRVYDYTNATDLLDEDDWSPSLPQTGKRSRRRRKDNPPPILVRVDGLDVRIDETARFVIVEDDEGGSLRLSEEEYRARLTRRLLERVQTLEDLRALWADTPRRRKLLEFLRDGQCPPRVLAVLSGMEEFDDFDVLAVGAYNAMPITRYERTVVFNDKHGEWLRGLPEKTAAVLSAFVGQFAGSGVDELENPRIFEVPAVQRAGGLPALSESGEKPRELLEEAKRRLFAA